MDPITIEAAYWAHCLACDWVSDECATWSAAEREGDNHAESEHPA